MTEEPSPLCTRILWAVAVLLFCLRFLWPGNTVYILDEAFMELRIDESLSAGTIPFTNSRGSSIPVPYGPGALWLYMLVRLASWRPEAKVIVHLALHALGAVFFVRTLSRAYGREATAWCAALAASSPLLFFYARHPWDSTLFLPMGALILWMLQKLKEGAPALWLHVALGFVAGYAVNTHLMFGPVALALGLTLLLRNLQEYGARGARAWALTAIFGFSAVVVLLPYLLEAARITASESPFAHARVKEHWGDARNLWWIFLRTTLFSSLFGSDVQLSDLRGPFFAFSGKVPALFFKVDYFGWFGKIAAWSGAFAVLFGLLRARVERDPLRLFAALAFFCTCVAYQYLNIPMAPHYFNPLWWFVFVGIAAAVAWMHGWWKRAFLFTLGATIAVNATYEVMALAYIHENRGARNMLTSTVVSEQLRNLGELCSWANAHQKTVVRVDKSQVALGEPAFDLLPAHMPECRGVRVALVASGADFILRYPRNSATSAALVAEPAEQAPKEAP